MLKGATSESTLAAFSQLDLSTTMILSCQLRVALYASVLTAVVVLVLARSRTIAPLARHLLQLRVFGVLCYSVDLM